MEYNTSELCDLFADSVDVVDPIFASFGGRYSFGGEITTIKCFEEFDASSAQIAIDNDWEGVVIYGSVREVDSLAELDIGVLAVAAIPVNAECESIGEVDVPVNFGGVTFLPEDHLYADSTGVILSPEPLDLD